MNHAGELAALTALVRPHVALVTAIAPAHSDILRRRRSDRRRQGRDLRRASSPAAPRSSRTTRPHRDRLVAAAAPPCRADRHLRPRRWRRRPRARRGPADDGGTLRQRQRCGERELTFTVAPPGEHWVSNALAVLAAVEAVGGDVAAAGLALAELGGLPGRGARRRIAVDGGEVLLIDESYNANPASMAATLALLGEERRRGAPASRVLGPMRELGEQSRCASTPRSRRPIVAAGVDHAHPRRRRDGAARRGACTAASRRACVADAARGDRRGSAQLVRPGDAVLVKASNSVGLATLVDRAGEGRLPCSI